LHLTLKFVGEGPDETVEKITAALAQIRANQFPLDFKGYGFFPTAKSARVFWVGIETGPALSAIAALIDDAVAGLGIPREERAFSPHLTLARAGSGAPGRRKDDNPNLRFAKLQQRLAPLVSPEFGTMKAREFFLYRSQLGRGGAQYTKIARFELNP
jgi:2'-5' RNA ligase